MGVALFAGIAISAAIGLANRLGMVGGTLSRAQTLAGLVAVTLYVLVAVCWLIGLAFVARRLGPRWALVVGLIGTAVVRFAMAVSIDVPLAGDWLEYHQQALDMAARGPQLGDLPIGYPLLLGGLYSALGGQTWLAEALNAVLALLTAAIVFDLLRRSAGPIAAAVGIGLVAILPSLALMTPLVGPDLTYTTLVLAAVWCVAVFGGMPSAWPSLGAGLAGVLLGASQYVRTWSLLLLPAFVILALVSTRGAHPRRAAVALVLAFLAVLTPVILDNALDHRQLSLATSSYAGWELYVGTDPALGGRLDRADADVLAAMPGDTVREKSDGAGREGLERIGADPGGFAALALQKVIAMWGDDGYAAFLALEWERDTPVAAGLLAAAHVASALAWAFVTMAAAWAVLRSGPVLPFGLLAAALLGASLTVLHAVIAVEPRYHAYLTPLWLAAAALALTRPRAATALEAPPPAPR